jgi:PAS domain S-box-containing protein
LKWFNEQLAKLTLPEKTSATVFDRQGNVLARHPDAERWLGKNIADTDIVKIVFTNVQGTVEAKGIAGVDRILSFMPIKGTNEGMYIVLGISTEIALFEANRTLMFNLILLIIIAVTATAVMWFGGETVILRRMKTLTKATNELSLGNLHTRVDISDKEDEISQLGYSFNKMAAALGQSIAERKQSEEALRESEKKLRDITSHLAEGIYVLDKEGKLTFMNTEAERLFGYTMDEMNKNNPHDLVHYLKPDGTPLLFEECKMHNVIKTGERYMSQNEVFIRKDGTVFPVSVITAPIIEDGRIIASVTAFRDITAYKKLDEEVLKAHKLESVGILAGGIAHDFNNLMQAIVGNVHVAKMHCQSGDKAFQRLTDAEKVLEQAKELSFRLLTFSKGGMPIKKLMSIKHLLSESNDLLRDSNISTEYSISNDLYPVEIDEGQMRQVFRNIIINAKEAMPDGGTLKVTATNVKLNKDNTFNIKDGNYVKISIQDNGTGISQEHLSKIFDPYFSTKQRYADKGLGLGLSVCYSIMKNHGGHIVAESIEGKGTTLHLYLPAKESR